MIKLTKKLLESFKENNVNFEDICMLLGLPKWKVYEYIKKNKIKIWIENKIRNDDGEKLCLKCFKWLDEKEFYKRKIHSDGLRVYCKDCIGKINSISIKHLYNSYKYNAPKRKNGLGLEFKLTYKEFEYIVKKYCVWCGNINEKGYNGIDRINNDIGYIHGNCMPCCTRCNIEIRGKISIEKMLEFLEDIGSNRLQKIKNNIKKWKKW